MCLISLPVCSSEIQTVGREDIISFCAGGGPVFSNCPNNFGWMREDKQVKEEGEKEKQSWKPF